MDEKRRKEIEFALNNTAAYPPLDATLIKGEIDFLSAALRDTWNALEAAERGLETVEWWAARYREQLAGVPGDTMQQQIEWLLEAAGVAREEA